jgi:hypothetical protein
MHKKALFVISQLGRLSGLKRRGVAALLALVLGLALGAASGYGYGRRTTAKGDAVTTSQAANVPKLNAEIRRLRTQLDTADGELAIERSARLALETELRTAQNEVGVVRDQLAFYERLFPPGPEGSVELRGAAINRQGSGLRYKVLLMRTGKGIFHGMLRFQSTGMRQGKMVSLDLEPMQLKSEGDQPLPDGPAHLLAVQFKYYQRSQGILGLPDGFVPDSVTISLLEGETVRASRTLKVEL